MEKNFGIILEHFLIQLIDFRNLKLNIMSSLKWKGRWNEIKGKVKQAYGNLTDDDLTYAEGQEEELLGKLQKETGKTKEEVENWLNDL